MPTATRLPRPARPTRHRPGWAAIGLLLAALAGCGPGVGGTGTGSEPPLVLFGATSSPVCTSPIAPALACASVTGAPSTAGTSAVTYSGSSPLGRLRSVFDGQRVKATIDCSGWQFDGEWGTDAEGRQRYFGSLVRSTGGAPEPAQLALQRRPDTSGGTVLLATVSDLADRPLLGPVELRTDVPPTTPSCP